MQKSFPGLLFYVLIELSALQALQFKTNMTTFSVIRIVALPHGTNKFDISTHIFVKSDKLCKGLQDELKPYIPLKFNETLNQYGNSNQGGQGADVVGEEGIEM